MPSDAKKAIDEVIDLWKKVKPDHGRKKDKQDHGWKVCPFQNPMTGEIIWKPEHVVEDNELLTILLLRVVKAGRLADLPPKLQEEARKRIARLQGHGDRETLRRARRGLEKGVKTPFSEFDVMLYAAISKLAPGRSQSQVLRLLGLGCSRQAFHKLLTRLDALHLFEDKDEDEE